MRLHVQYSRHAQAAYVYIGAQRLAFRQITPVGRDDDVVVDIDEDGMVVGVEFLGVEEPTFETIEEDHRPVVTVDPDDELL